MENEIKTLIEAIKTDYINFCTRGGKKELSGYFKETVENFDNGIEIAEGRKYIKIIRDNSVWGFIVKKDGGKFRAGDILKPAGWATPATNHARGNILDGGYSISWTGPHYMR